MKFSIITCTHKKIPYLVDLYESIKAQTYVDWEWVIWLNGDIKLSDLSNDILEDERVKPFVYDGDYTDNIGFHKHEAFYKGIGDVLVEVDHDDVLIETCLSELYDAYLDTEVGFVYSDTALFNMEGEVTPYGAHCGWTHKTFSWRGLNLISHDSFEPTGRSIGLIWYAPDHVRSWRASVYRELGGHNVDLSVCDDQELLIRTYLVTKFCHVPKTLYVYRIWGDNTWLQKNAMIQERTVEIYKQNCRALAERDADLNNLLKIDLGQSKSSLGGYLSVNFEDGEVIYDLEKGIPLGDNSVGVLNADNFIQKITDKTHLMSEVHRVLCDGGSAFITVPSTDGRGAFQDPTNKSYWNENSFWYYTKKEYASKIKNTSIKFQILGDQLDTEWEDNERVTVKTVLSAVKTDKRRPGSIEI